MKNSAATEDRRVDGRGTVAVGRGDLTAGADRSERHDATRAGHRDDIRAGHRDDTRGGYHDDTGAQVYGSTRERVVSSILHHGPSTAGELAERLGLTAAAVRRHLTGLTEDGLVTSREKRVFGARGRGRPSRVFLLTDDGRAEYYTAYDELAITALRQLAAAAGPEALAVVAQARVDDIERRYRARREELPDQDPALTLAECLSADGYAATLRPAAVGQQICQHNCPVAEVAKVFPQLCEVETQLFSQLLGSHVQRLATIAHGDGVCTTHVPVDVEELRRRTRSAPTTDPTS